MTTFLPEPRVPLFAGAGSIPEPGMLAGLVPEADAYLTRIGELRRETDQAVLALDAHRPGGKVWEEALREDAEAALAGTPPKVWGTAELLRGDADRWAHASALARTLTKRVEAVRLEATRDKGVAVKVKTLNERLRAVYSVEAPGAWEAARTGDKVTAWAHHGECQRVAVTLRLLDRWAAWLEADGDLERRARGVARVEDAALGMVLAAGYYLGEPKPLIAPQYVTWPAGFDLDQLTPAPKYRAWSPPERGVPAGGQPSRVPLGS